MIDISHNRLTSLRGLEGAPELVTVVANANALCGAAPLDPLKGCPALSELHVQDNHLTLEALAPLASLRALSVLVASGNPTRSRQELLDAVPQLRLLRVSAAACQGVLEDSL